MKIHLDTAGPAAYTPALSGTQPPFSQTSGARSLEKNRGLGAFDQVDISRQTSGQSRFQKELAARLVRDIRASGSTGALQQVREEIQGGTYPLDAGSIAAAMLLET